MGQQARLIDWKWKQERINGVHTMEGKTAMGAIVDGGRRKMRQQSIETKLATPLSIWFREQQKTHIQHFLHFYSGCYCCCCWFCLLFPPQTESINFPFFPFRNDSRCIFYSGFLLFVFISSVSSHFSFFFVDGRSFWNFKFQIIRVRANILNHILNIVFRVLCIFCCCVLIVNILFNFWWQSHTSWQIRSTIS